MTGVRRGWQNGVPPLAPLEAGRSIHARFTLTPIASPAIRWLALAGRGSNRRAPFAPASDGRGSWCSESVPRSATHAAPHVSPRPLPPSSGRRRMAVGRCRPDQTARRDAGDAERGPHRARNASPVARVCREAPDGGCSAAGPASLRVVHRRVVVRGGTHAPRPRVDDQCSVSLRGDSLP
jgi:hypothetical protein